MSFKKIIVKRKQGTKQTAHPQKLTFWSMAREEDRKSVDK